MANQDKMITILRIDASLRGSGSTTRQMTEAAVEQLLERFPNAQVIQRNMAEPLPLLDEAWVAANFTDESERTPEQREKLALSDSLIQELVAADYVVIGVPIYNFSIPTQLKAWFDMLGRARVTFRYTENGPVGMLKDRPTLVMAASGGTPVGSAIDFATPYVRHFLGFVGIKDVTVFAADRQSARGEDALGGAIAEIREHLAPVTA